MCIEAFQMYSFSKLEVNNTLLKTVTMLYITFAELTNYVPESYIL
jgi:hypothetical protein